MSSKPFVLGVALAVFASVGCTGVFVPKTQYDRDVNQLKEYVAALERDNAALRPTKEAYERLKAQSDFHTGAGKAWEEMAAALKKALDGLAVDPADFSYNPKTNSYTFAADLLFDSGKYEVSAKGKEVLKKFAETHRGARLRIVGHTDATRVVKASTKERLFTDTNLELSALRATAVGYELIRHGVPERNLWVEGRGSSEPREGGLSRCRRVEIFIVGGSPSPVVPDARPAAPVKAAHKTVNK